MRVSRDGGVHWTAAAAPPPGAPIVVFTEPFESPILVTSEGVFTTSDSDGERFVPVAGGRRGVSAAQLLAGKDGEAVLEVRSGDVLAYWDGRRWSTKKKALLGGGIFMQNNAASKPVGGWTNLQDVDGTLFWQEGPTRRAFTSPRAALTLASAAETRGGRVYVGTMGDGLFLFEP